MDYSLNNTFILVGDIKKGNEKAFRFVFDNLYDQLVIYVLGLTNDKGKAEDIVQGVFVKVWEKRSNLGITTSIKSYFYRACYNDFVNQYRVEKDHISLSDSLFTQIYENDTDDDRHEDLLQELKKAMDNLPEKRKEILILHKIKGYKYQEIASQLNLSIKTVKNQLFRAYNQIRDAMSDGFK
ncbi:RNA polymerase sigma factor [Belliella marina]|uniref:RNA polymerase sigma factor n=1 Tax=Belliella marina TaxID=1644146 RepID=A0ABW4VRH6_9BACT